MAITHRNRAKSTNASGSQLTSVRLEAVEKRFGTTLALQGLTMHIQAGELLVLLGPSGCGKTTTLNVIAGLEEPTRGDVFFDDERVTHVPPDRRDIAMVFQTFGLYPHLNARENIVFPIKLRRVPSKIIEERVAEITSLLGIQRLLSRNLRELSGGERQRVAIAKALVRRPRLLLLDEPYSALDAEIRRFLRAELVRIHREFATTTVFVTHDQEEAMSIADRTAVLRDGTLQQIDTPLNLYNRPATQWVAQFVGTYKINLLDAQRAKSEDGFALELQLGGQTFACECRDKDAIRRLTTSMHGRRCRIGVRPEHVSLSPPGTNGTALRGEIFTRQVLGKEILYDVTVADTHLRAVVPAKHLYDLGEPVELTFNWQEMLFFDAETGHALNV